MGKYDDIDKVEIYSVRDVANITGITCDAIRRAINKNKLKAFKQSHQYFIFSPDLEEYLEERRKYYEG